MESCQPSVFVVRSRADSDIEIREPRLEKLVMQFRTSLISDLAARYSVRELNEITVKAIEERSVDQEFQNWVGKAIGGALMAARYRTDDCDEQP